MTPCRAGKVQIFRRSVLFPLWIRFPSVSQAEVGIQHLQEANLRKPAGEKSLHHHVSQREGMQHWPLPTVMQRSTDTNRSLELISGEPNLVHTNYSFEVHWMLM